jgi:hypothetical protein
VAERNGPEGLAPALGCDDGRYLLWIRTICRWFVIVGRTHFGRFSHGPLLSEIGANQIFDCPDRRIPAVAIGRELNGLGVCRGLVAGGIAVWVVDTDEPALLTVSEHREEPEALYRFRLSKSSRGRTTRFIFAYSAENVTAKLSACSRGGTPSESRASPYEPSVGGNECQYI